MSKQELPIQEKDEIISLRLNKWSYKKIAKKYGRSSKFIKKICIDNGVSLELGNQYTNGKFDRIENAKRYIRERTPGFEYAGNFTGVDGRVDLKCKTCGNIINRSFISVRKGKICCDNCKHIEAEERRKRRQAEEQKTKEAKRKAREQARAKRKKEQQEKEQSRVHPCIVCGTLTKRKKYCSDACANKAENKRKEIKRRAKISDAMIDTDITLEALYKRDRGYCYLCGLFCNLEDYTVRDGTIITGDWYPSIEHVLPLSKGGKHAWSNVKLAHRRCNYIKGDEVKGGQ